MDFDPGIWNRKFLFLIWILEFLYGVAEPLMCDRTMGITLPKTHGTIPPKFEVIIQDDPGKYVPGAIYTVRIKGHGSEKFSRFLLVAEPDLGNPGQSSAGTFRLKDDSMARISEFCPNAVKDASEVPKSDVQVLWIAPQVSVGCVIFRATVVKNNHQWYMDDDSLTKKLCLEDDAQEDAESLEPCTACDEAKYELIFEGTWSSLTHHKHFPENQWTPSFSDIIGASHSPQFRFWDYGKEASEGLRQVAESGDSRLLENELKEQSEQIRTIIKARGLRYTNFIGLKTFAVFRADKNHNLISFVSKIEPSPDWFVGVSGLNLCGRNGSWVVEKEMNLFPVDAGTDSGPSYSSSNMPTMPKAKVQRLVWSSNPDSPFYDNDGNMLKPFAKLRIQQQRTYRRGSCEETYNINEIGPPNDYGEDGIIDDSPHRDIAECAMQLWSGWTTCHPTCGDGTQKKYRKYTNEAIAREYGCDRKKYVQRICQNPYPCKGRNLGTPIIPGTFDESPQKELENYDIDKIGTFNPDHLWRNSYSTGDFSGKIEPNDDACATTEWRPWSHCSDPCGTTPQFRTRSFRYPARAKSQRCEFRNVKLRESKRCPKLAECRDNETPSMEKDCEVTDWGDWQPCSATCGKGMKKRERLYKDATKDHRKCNVIMYETEPCNGPILRCPPERTTADCLEPVIEGECRNKLTRWYFNRVKLRCETFVYSGCKATRNNFLSLQECDATCHSLKEALAEERSEIQSKYGVVISSAFTYMMADESRANSDCDTYSRTPNRTRHSRLGSESLAPYNQYQRHPVGEYIQNSQRVYQPPTPMSTNFNHHFNQPAYNDGPSIDCKLSPWSPWSTCNVSCGRGWKYQTRYVEVFNENGGRPCSPLLERSRRCRGMRCPHSSAHMMNYGTGYNPLDDYNYQD